MMQGFVDGVGPRSVYGWAIGDEGGSPRLNVRMNGVAVTELAPDQPRPDLTRLLGDDIRPGFEVDLGRPLAPGDLIEVCGADGAHLGGSPWSVSPRPNELGREAKALALIDRSMRILEIGPSFNPLAPRSQGWNSSSLDHATQAELIEKYRGQQPVENIEPVDFIWTQGPIADAIPAELHGSFDAVIASHVIEHFPDPIDFYLSAARLLKDGGVISLLVPDKRFMFDFFKPVSMTSDLLVAHSERRARHSRKTAFDYVAYNVFERGDVAWFPRPVADFTFPGGDDPLQGALKAFEEMPLDGGAGYVDFHNTIYTPSSFQLLILELGQLGLIPFEIAATFPSAGCEFFVTLRRADVAPLPSQALASERLRLLRQVVTEQAEQAGWLAAS